MDERELMAALRRGDEAAWDDAFRRLYPCALAAARHPAAGLDPSRAEDVAIEVLSQLAAKAGGVNDWDGLRALTATMAARRAISERRRLGAQKRGGGRTDSLDRLRDGTEAGGGGGGGYEPPDETPGLSPIELRELGGLMREAFAGLDPLTRTLIHDYVVEGIPYKDLAARHGIPLGTVGVNLSRGLKKIRRHLDGHPRLLKEIRAHLR